MRRLSIPSFLALFLAALCTACSGSDNAVDILDAVPVDARTVGIFDFDHLQKSGVNLSQEQAIRNLTPLRSGVSACVTLNDGSSFGILLNPSPDSLSAIGFKPAEPEGSLTPWTNEDGMTVVLNAKSSFAYAFPLSAPRALELSQTLVDATNKESFASNHGLKEYIRKAAGSDAFIYGMTAIAPASSNPQSGRWLAFNALDDHSKEIVVRASLLEGSGKPIEIDGMQEISTDFLRYIPDSMNIVAAAGLTPDIDWDAATAFLSLISDRSTASAIAFIKPYLKKIDGTIAVALNFPENSYIQSLADLRIFAMAHIDPKERQDIIDQIMRLALLSGLQGLNPTIDEKTNTIRLTIPAPDPAFLYIGEVDGYLYLASWPIKPDANNSYAPAFEGHDAAAIVNIIADRSFRSLGIPEGKQINMTFALDDGQATLRLSLDGSAQAILRQFLND